MNATSMVLPRWEEYRSDAPEGSDAWATTDRGWCYDAAHEREEISSIGNYLRYTFDRGPNGETVHACAYRMEQAPLSSTYTTYRRGSGWFHTIEDAKAFIVAQAGAR